MHRKYRRMFRRALVVAKMLMSVVCWWLQGRLGERAERPEPELETGAAEGRRRAVR
jgi:hypothetical protein